MSSLDADEMHYPLTTDPIWFLYFWVDKHPRQYSLVVEIAVALERIEGCVD